MQTTAVVGTINRHLQTLQSNLVQKNEGLANRIQLVFTSVRDFMSFLRDRRVLGDDAPRELQNIATQLNYLIDNLNDLKEEKKEEAPLDLPHPPGGPALHPPVAPVVAVVAPPVVQARAGFRLNKKQKVLALSVAVALLAIGLTDPYGLGSRVVIPLVQGIGRAAVATIQNGVPLVFSAGVAVIRIVGSFLGV